MKKTLLAVALTAALTGTPLMADSSLEDRVQRLEQLLGGLQDRVDEQDRIIGQQDQTIRRQGKTIERQTDLIDSQQKQLVTGGASSTGGGWFQNVDLGGVVEVEANHTDPYTGNSSNDLVLATVEVAISSQVNDWVRADIVLLHEEDDTDLEVDVGTITVAPPDGGWFLTTGQFYLPFGAYESNMISDPLTLEIGETRESALQVGFENGPFSGSVYAFNGTNKRNRGVEDRIDNWGANLAVAHEANGVNLSAGAGYINDIGDSDTLQDQINTNLTTNDVRDHISGWTANAMAEAGSFVFIGEYLAATDDFETTELPFDGSGAEPKAWNAEVGYNFDLMGKDSTVAVGYQRTKEALGLGLPKRRWLLGWSVNILENTALSFEVAHDKDYRTSDTSTDSDGNAVSGTGESSNTITTQLAVEFP